MLSTYTSYNLIAGDLDKSLSNTASKTDVARETEYYKAHISDVKSIDDLLGNDRLYRYVMKAYNLTDMTYAKGMIRKVLEGGVSDSSSLASQLSDTRFKALATAFDFAAQGEATTSSTAVQTDTVNDYVRQTLETTSGEENEGVRLALYFARKAPDVTSAYGILADAALLKVVQTTLGISEMASLQDIDTQAKTIESMMDVADLQDPEKLDKFIEKFTAKYDVENGSAAADPTISLFSSSSEVTISSDLLMSIQSLRLGGT
jgi:hypothetical protein